MKPHTVSISYVKKREKKSNNNTHSEQQQQRQQHYVCTWYIKLTSRLLRRHFNHHRWCTYFYTGTKKKSSTKKKKHLVLDSILRRRVKRDSNVSVNELSFLHDIFSDWYVSICTIDVWKKNDKQTKRAPVAGRRREHGLGRYLQGREGRARWGTSSNQRNERWTSFRSKTFTAQNLV